MHVARLHPVQTIDLSIYVNKAETTTRGVYKGGFGSRLLPFGLREPIKVSPPNPGRLKKKTTLLARLSPILETNMKEVRVKRNSY